MAVGQRNAAARKAAPAKAAKATAKPAEDEPDLLAGLSDEAPAAVEDAEEVADLLGGISEDTGTPWIPWDDDDCPDGVQGKVIYRGTVPSDYGPEECPLVELEAADGTVWSIRGYATALRNQILKADPQPGDTMAAKYFGLKPSKNGKDYHNAKVVVRKAA